MIKVLSLMIVELGANAVVTGLLLGGLYAVASLGLTIAFGLLQIPNVAHPTFMVLGALIIFFLIVEPHGLARLWQIGKQKLRVWPFPY